MQVQGEEFEEIKNEKHVYGTGQIRQALKDLRISPVIEKSAEKIF